jgi:periplasmic mercuric ion binding protein
MKTIQKLLITVILAAFPLMLTAQDKDKNTETVKFTTSISCANCVNKIMTNLPQEKGIKDVKCDLATKQVAVTYQKDKNNPAEIKKAIEKLGYTAKEVIADNSVKKDK